MFEIFQTLLLVFGDMTAVMDSMAVYWQNFVGPEPEWDRNVRSDSTLLDIILMCLTIAVYVFLFFTDRD